MDAVLLELEYSSFGDKIIKVVIARKDEKEIEASASHGSSGAVVTEFGTRNTELEYDG